MSAEKRIGSRRPDRRDEVLRAALRVIEREGLEGASMRAIASEIGCTTGVLTHFFRSKQELIDAATDTVFGPFDAGLAAEFEGEDVRRRLRRVLVNVLPVNAANRGVIRLWLELARGAWSSRTFAAGYRERYAALRRAIEDVLCEGRASGVFRSDVDPAIECDTLSALFDGLAVAALAEPERFPPGRLEQLIDRQIERLFPPTVTGRRVRRARTKRTR